MWLERCWGQAVSSAAELAVGGGGGGGGVEVVVVVSMEESELTGAWERSRQAWDQRRRLTGSDISLQLAVSWCPRPFLPPPPPHPVSHGPKHSCNANQQTQGEHAKPPSCMWDRPSNLLIIPLR